MLTRRGQLSEYPGGQLSGSGDTARIADDARDARLRLQALILPLADHVYVACGVPKR